jgi:hypothetical protein
MYQNVAIRTHAGIDILLISPSGLCIYSFWTTHFEHKSKSENKKHYAKKYYSVLSAIYLQLGQVFFATDLMKISYPFNNISKNLTFFFGKRNKIYKVCVLIKQKQRVLETTFV